MKTYLVGGAVRDALLKREVKDRDWVVVGADKDTMLAQGYMQVGKDFPVFLHPTSKEEYALARTERKTGTGYTGFSTEFGPEITLEQDLERRDLTINAIALDEQGKHVDPFGGIDDLNNRVIRHVSPAFVEDPLRVFRVARFAARFKQYGFSIAEATMQLMTGICQGSEVESLSAERIWVETQKALSEANPEVYFETLQACNGLTYWFPELEQLWGVPNPAKWHPEIDTGVHTMMTLQQAAELSDSTSVRFAALCHDLGKGITPQEIWPKHTGHEGKGVPLVESLCARIKAPNQFKELAMLVCGQHGNIHRAKQLKASTVLKLFDQCDAWRRPGRFTEILLACKADARGRLHFEQSEYPQAAYLESCLDAARQCPVQDIVAQGYKGAQIKEQLYNRRLDAVKTVKNQFQWPVSGTH